MKKFFLILFTFIFVMISCSKKEDSKEVFTIAIDPNYPPFEYVDLQKDQFTGFNYDLLIELSKRCGFKLKFINSSFKTIISGIQKNDFDLGLSFLCSPTNKNEEMIKFSKGYFFTDIIVLGNKDNFNHNDLKKIGATANTIFYDRASRISQSTPVETLNNNEAVDKLIIGDVDFVIMDLISAKSYTSIYSQLYIKEIIGNYTVEFPMSEVFANRFLEKINATFDEMESDGTFGKLKEKYKLN